MASPTPVASTTRGVSAEDRERGEVVLLADVEAGKEAWGVPGKLHRVGVVGEGVAKGGRRERSAADRDKVAAIEAAELAVAGVY